MDLYINNRPSFTKWVVKEGLLTERFVLVDIGCRGGIHGRWRYLEDHLEVFAFDADPLAIEEMPATAVRNGEHHCFATGIGDRDGEYDFFLTDNAYAASFLDPGSGEKYRTSFEPGGSLKITVPQRSLDSLFSEGAIKKADFLKIDVEGFEEKVLRGAKNFLRDAGVFGVDLETSMGTSIHWPRSHFVQCYELLLAARLCVFDMSFDRTARSCFLQRIGEAKKFVFAHYDLIGQTSTYNVLLARDFIMETNHPQNFVPAVDVSPNPSFQVILKQAIAFELYGLNDCALDLIEFHADCIEPYLDADKATALLMELAYPRVDNVSLRLGNVGRAFVTQNLERVERLSAEVTALHGELAAIREQLAAAQSAKTQS